MMRAVDAGSAMEIALMVLALAVRAGSLGAIPRRARPQAADPVGTRALAPRNGNRPSGRSAWLKAMREVSLLPPERKLRARGS